MICVFVHGHCRCRMKTMSALRASWKHECCSSKIHTSERRAEQVLCSHQQIICLSRRVCACVCHLPKLCSLEFFLQRPQSPSLVQVTQELPASRGRSRSSTSHRRRVARSDCTSLLHGLLGWIHIFRHSFVCSLFVNLC